MGGGGRVALCVRSLEVARQRQGRHVLLQGFLTSAQNMMLLFMQVNLFGVAAQRQRAGQGNLHRYDTDPRDSERHLVLAVRFKAQLWNIHTSRRHVNVKTRSRPLQPYQQITSVTHTRAAACSLSRRESAGCGSRAFLDQM